ncbi:MAG: transporter [Pseudomonadota bacterium]
MALVTIFCVCAGPLAHAGNPKINVDDFQPSPHAGDILDTVTTRVGPHLGVSGGVWFTYRKDPLVAVGFEGEGEVALVGDQLVGDLQVALPLFGLASVGIDLPVLLHSAGGDPALVNPAWTQVAGAGLGDLRLSFKAKFWDNHNKGFGLGVAQDLTLPTSVGDKLFGADAPTSVTRLILDYQIKGFIVALNVGYLARKAAREFTPPVSDELLLGIGLRIPILRDRLELLLSSQTRTLVDSAFTGERSLATAIRGGLQVRAGSDLMIGVAGGAGFGDLAGSAAWEAMLHVAWEPRQRVEN